MITVRRAFSGLPIVIALMAMIVVMLAQPVRAAPKILIFSAMEAPETPTDWAAVLGGVKGPEAPEKAAAIAALTAAERNPSMATAVGLLAHFETFAKNPDFRTAALGANIDVFRMADLAKYELVAETSARINDTVEGGVAAVVRVGSSGARFQAWLDWAKQNPRGPMPVDASYELSKLFKSDDDVTHWAGEHARMSNSVANELINGEAAARVFADITSEHLQQYPDEYRSLKVNLGTESVTADALTGGTEIPPTRMMVEFLSPTSAREIMANDAERTRRGWPVLIDLTTKDFLPAWILAEPEKYNGLFAAEQLHEWGIQAGFVTENPGDPLHTTVTYAQSAESGVLKPITGDDVFPSGIRDPFGWMANNYRQIFVTHKKEIEKGEVDAIAKYTLRMEDWWDKVGLRHGESLALTKDVVVPDFDVELELQPLQMAMNEIRKPSSPEARDAAITRAAATEKALFKKLVAYNEQMLIAGHRKHFNVLVQTLTDAVAADYQRNPPRPGVEQKPLTLDDIWRLAKDAGGSATRNPADPNATDTNIFHFRESLQAMANGYANLPEEAVQMLARDLAGFIETEAKRPDADPVRAEIRAAIIPTLREAVEQARSVGAELKGQAMAFEDLKAIRDSPIGEALNSELERLKQPDLDHYLLKIVRGDLTVRRLVYDPGTEGGWPALRMVEARWTPDAVAADVDRIKALAETFGWSNAGYAERLAAYFGGPRDAEGHPAPGFADRAVNLFLELGRLFEPGETVSRKVTYQTVDGETRTLTLESTKFWDSSLNIGHMLFAETIKGGEVGIKLWGIKGDVESLKGLADAMAKIISPDRNATPESRAAALASAAANALSLTSYVEMGLAKAGYSDAASALGETSVIGRFGNTFGALAQYSNDPVSREAPAAFTQAVMQDLLIWAQPQVATVLVLHSIYQAASTTYTDVYSKSALVDLFLRNGRWSFPEDGKKPVLEAVYAHGGWITDDAKGRGDQCRARLLAQGQIGKTPSFSPLGVEKLFRVPTDAEKEGIALCQGTLGEKCPMSDGSRVKPRDELMALYKSAGYASSDPLQKTTQDAVNDMLSTGIVRDVLRDIAGWADISGLGRKDLEGHGIFVPTPEDATYFVREPIRIDDNPLGIRVESDAMDTTVTAAPTWIQAQLKIGARKVYGYMVSQSWVRRQHILDCTMLDPIIAEAGRRAQEERIKTMDPTDFLDQLAVLDERVKAIDTAIWPKIAASADAYPADFPADAEKIAILRDFQRLTNDQRAALKAIDAWTKDPSSGDPPWFAIPFQLVVAPDAGPFDSPVSFPSDRPVGERLVEAGRDHLRSVLDAAIAYEEAFDAAGKTMAEVAALARSADTLDITPLHLHVLPPDSDTGTPAVPPVTTPERTPTTADFGSTIKTHKTLADLKTETAAWDKVYTEARTRAFNDMEARMAAFQQRLQPLWLEYMGRENLINNPLTAIAREQPGDLALAHPLWPRVLRLALQGARLEQAGKDGERMDEAEFAALAASITLYPVDENAPAPDLGSGDVAGRIKALKAAVDARYAEMLKLVEQMFEMSFDTDGAKWVVLGQPDVRLKTRPIAKSGLTEEMIKGWADRTVWELVPATDAMLKDVAALVSLSGETADSIPTISAVTEETQRTDRAVAAALGICSSSNRSDAFQRRFRVVETREEPVISYPLTRAGRYLMRITVLTEKGIPLAQRQAFVIVRAGTLKGRLVLEGGLGQERSVRIGFGRPTASEDPQFLVLQGAGDFEAPLCEFTEDEAIRMAGGKPEILSESELDKRFQARSTAIAGVTQPLTGKPVTALYKLNPDYLVERRHFELEDDLVLSDSGMVSVAVEVKDWSGAPLPSADVTITAGDATDVGVSEGEYPLAKGDLVKAEAALTVDGEAHKGRSESRFFDPAEDSGGITLSVDVPVFDTGNLTVTGAFKPDAAAAALGGIAGGTAHANIVRGQPISVSGPDFVIYNSQPVAASNGFTLTALLTAPDGKVSFLTPKCATASGIHDACTVRRDLTKGARLALEPIVVGPFSTRPQLLRIAVTDWSGAPIATDRVEVTIADKPAQRDFDSFFGDVSFSGRNEKLAVKARYTTLDGREIEAEETLAIDAVGDPLDPVQPDALTLRLPVYPSGRFRVVGNLRLEASAGQPDGTPATVTVTPASGVADPWNAVVGERMQFDLSGDVEPGEAVAIAGEARFDGADYKGDASGTAPQLGPANAPAILDIGDLVLRTAAPPDASDETATEPQPDEPDEPEQPPAGIAVPPLAGQTIDQATGTLAALGLAISPEALTGDPQGAAPSTVVLQDPAAGERLPEGGTVAVYYYPEASASVAEAPPPPETPPAVEPEPDTGQPAEEPAQDETADEAPADESPAPPPAVAVAPAPAGAPVSYPGGWLGDLRLTDIDFNVKGIRFKCAAFDPCVSLWSDVTYNMIAKSIAKDRAEREREVANMTPGEKLADALDFGGAIADGMGNAIMAAVAIGGIIGFDMAFDGIPAGFILTETETGIAFSLPQLGQKGSQIPEFLPTTQQDGGGLQLDYSVTENGATVELSGTIHPSATAEGHLDLSLTVRISKPGEGNGRVDLSGTFEPGTPSKEAIVEVTKAQFKQRFEKPNGRILMPIKEMTEKLDKLMKADDKSD